MKNANKVNLTKTEAVKLSKKLEFNFRKANPDFVNRLANATRSIVLTNSDAQLAYSKLEYRFKKSDDALVTKLKESVE